MAPRTWTTKEQAEFLKARIPRYQKAREEKERDNSALSAFRAEVEAEFAEKWPYVVPGEDMGSTIDLTPAQIEERRIELSASVMALTAKVN